MKLPNGPQSPAVLQMLRWITSPMSFMETCAERYGDMFTIRLESKSPPLIFVSNPEVLQQILTNDTKALEASGDTNLVFESLLGKRSVITIAYSWQLRMKQVNQ